jgi:hypothetical protein
MTNRDKQGRFVATKKTTKTATKKVKVKSTLAKLELWMDGMLASYDYGRMAGRLYYCARTRHMFLLNNQHDGARPDSTAWKKFGYKYSYMLSLGDVIRLTLGQVKEPHFKVLSYDSKVTRASVKFGCQTYSNEQVFEFEKLLRLVSGSEYFKLL